MSTPRPWYREPFVWLIISFPLIAVIAGIATYVIADRTADGLVVDDYYRRGKEINVDLARDRAAAEHGLSGQLRISGANLALKLRARTGYAVSGTVLIRWLHATRGGFDQSQLLQRSRAGQEFRAGLPKLAPGHWYIQVEAEDWRLQGSLHLPRDTAVELRPTVGH